MKDAILKFLTGTLIFAGGAILNYFGSSPRVLYVPAIALCLWVSWIILSGVHTYVSKEDARLLVKATVPDAPTLPPLAHTPDDLPPKQESPLPSSLTILGNPSSINNPGSGSINTIDQRGGSNVINNFAPPARQITQEQSTIFKSDLANASKTAEIKISVWGADSEAYAYAGQIMELLVDAGFKPIQFLVVGPGMPPNFPDGVSVGIKDPKNITPMAGTLFNAFDNAGIKIQRAHDLSIADPEAVTIYVGKQPPWAQAEGTSPTINSQTGQGSVNAPNNQGNINTGTVSGNLSQTVNIGNKPRVLSPDQMSMLVKALSGLPPVNVSITYATSDPEVVSFAQQLVTALRQANVNPNVSAAGIVASWMPVANVHIAAGDERSAPAIAVAFQRTLVEMGFVCDGMLYPEPQGAADKWDRSKEVEITVGPISPK